MPGKPGNMTVKAIDNLVGELAKKGMTVNKLMDAVLDTSDMTDDECKAELAASGVDVQAASRRFDERLAALAKRGKV